MSSIINIMKERTSANAYDPNQTLTDDEIENLVSLAARSPSAFNLQNWKIVAVSSKQAKERLLPLAMAQPKVM